MGSLAFGQVRRTTAYSCQSAFNWDLGFKPTLPLCLTPALTLLLYQLLSRIRVPWKAPSSRQSATSAFLSGASANALALTILYPLLLAKVRVQAARSKAGNNGANVPSSMTQVWAAAIRNDGWGGLYQALGAQILKGFVNQGVTMLVKQRSVCLRSLQTVLLTICYQYRAGNHPAVYPIMHGVKSKVRCPVISCHVIY